MRGQMCVLHVDDDPGFLRLTAELLGEQSEQFDVVSKSSIEEAAAYLDDTPDVDCIVCDYALREANGVEFLKTVRADHPNLPFILFTGRGSESVASEALTNGATDYLQKQSGSEQYELLANRIGNAVQQYWNELEQEISERYRQELYHIATETSLEMEEKIEKLLTLGCERLDIENGFIAEIDPKARRHRIRWVAGSDAIQRDTVTDLDEAYCRETVTSENVLAVYDSHEEGWGDDAAYERWAFGCYIGGRIEVDRRLYGTLCFADSQPRDRPFTEAERTFVDLMTRHLTQLFERRTHEQECGGHRALLEALPIGYARITADGEFREVNPSFVAMVGGETEADVLGRRIEELFCGSTTPDQLLERFPLSEETTQQETELTTLTGETIRVSLTGRLVDRRDGQYVDTLVQELS